MVGICCAYPDAFDLMITLPDTNKDFVAELPHNTYAGANDDNGQQHLAFPAIQNVVVKQLVFQHMITSPHISDVEDVTDSFVTAIVPTIHLFAFQGNYGLKRVNKSSNGVPGKSNNLSLLFWTNGYTLSAIREETTSGCLALNIGLGVLENWWYNGRWMTRLITTGKNH
nr:hypothetical protein [Tanacetum cinerariifolium]